MATKRADKQTSWLCCNNFFQAHYIEVKSDCRALPIAAREFVRHNRLSHESFFDKSLIPAIMVGLPARLMTPD
jgi:hypothetical protein